MAAFLAVTLFLFFWVEAYFARNIADVRPMFEWLPALLVFLCSALTMRMWSEERRSGTLHSAIDACECRWSVAGAPAGPRPASPPFSSFRSPAVWLLGVIYWLFGFTYVIYVTFFVTSLVKERGFSEGIAGSFWSVIGFLSLFSGPVFGTLSDRLGRRAGLAIVFSLQAVAYLLVALPLPPAALYLSIFCFGIVAWSIPSIMLAAVSDQVGPEHALSAFGFITFVFGVGQIAGPAVAGALLVAGVGACFLVNAISYLAVLLGLVAGLMPAVTWLNKGYGHSDFDPIYETAERLNMPLTVHGAPSRSMGFDFFNKFLHVHTLEHPFAILIQFTHMVFEGVFVRFPKLRVAFLEAGSGWLPYMMDRMDEEMEKPYRVQAPLLKQKPSELIRNGQIELRDAKHLRGKTTFETGDTIVVP